MMLFVACKPGTPSQYIQPDEMEDILVEYYMAKAMHNRIPHRMKGNTI
jgi:hypothetical protein